MFRQGGRDAFASNPQKMGFLLGINAHCLGILVDFWKQNALVHWITDIIIIIIIILIIIITIIIIIIIIQEIYQAPTLWCGSKRWTTQHFWTWTAKCSLNSVSKQEDASFCHASFVLIHSFSDARLFRIPSLRNQIKCRNGQHSCWYQGKIFQ